ncbi:Receptor-like serine/threonine-protein kinase SD1-8 [Platanthera zijinensis]|uniref:Receptor-like serine/threonine-protein kinase SD1-8 n=1 Tax=Platanthera zijinensis TaxID=2320716 RepID=A0AAP0BYF7_9ASPA
MGINLHSILLLFFNLLPFSAPTDTITPSQPLPDGQLLISVAGTFSLGFFTAGDPTKRYVGVWYANDLHATKVLWVANRKTPVSGTDSVLSLTADGNLTLLDGAAGKPSWSTNTSGLNNPSLKLLKSGNIVLAAGSTISWQSFDFPTDVLLPGMEIGYRLKLTASPDMVVWNKSTSEYRTGPWDDGS